MTDTAKPDYGDTLEAQTMCAMIAGGETLHGACRALGLAVSTTYARKDQNPKFREMLEEARQLGYDAIANQCLDIADDGTNDIEGGMLNREHIQRSKLRVETRLKLLAKWHPKKYGEKLQIESKSATVAIPMTDDPVEAQKAYEDLMRGNS